MTEPKCSPHGWTLDTLEKYLGDQVVALRRQVEEQDARNLERFASAKEAVNAALAAADKALAKAESASEKRFEGLNELRAMAGDQGRMFLDQIKDLLPRAEYVAQHQALVEKVDSNIARISNMETTQITKKESASTSVSLLIAIGPIIGAVVGIAATHFLK